MKTLGVIGGSGLYEMPGLKIMEGVTVSTPFGEPSDEFILGRLGDVQLVFLPRHGRGHRLLPTEINYRANIFGMKKLGVEWLVSVAAVGSLRREIEPGHMVVPDQFIDRTVARPSTFFGGGIVAHVSMADPVCAGLARLTSDAARWAGATVHEGGTYLCMEGPQFSTRAESELYRAWRGDVIGMTNWQEAKLAREAEICFATLAIVSDYDCWNTDAHDVTIDEILRLLAENADLARRCVSRVAAGLPESRQCACVSALKDTIVTDPAEIPAQVRRDLSILIGRYLED
jgi:5'-methylthioadenosine phosphorylase